MRSRFNAAFWEEIYFPLTLIADRYSGTYSGAQFTAWPLYARDIPHGAVANDVTCADFWADEEHLKYPIGKGKTPQEAYDNLIELVGIIANES